MLALVLIILILLFDILLLVDSVDKWRLQLTKYVNNESVLEAESDTIKRDTDVLIMTASFYSFALGSMTMRWVYYGQSQGMKLLWLGTVPLTSGLVAHMFGVRYLSMLFGITFLSHQVGSFLGVWLGGYLYETTGSYDLVWYGSIVLGFAAAALHIPIPERRAAPAAA